ncbi:MAG TPA: glycoside hydrolase family 3 N-terminal domain-containing protein [Vicinamibacteria bacterium]|nr:glycoside hydrolase family 3 N-terminal domain-containing protein [Vicinamibacteria bacterium]
MKAKLPVLICAALVSSLATAPAPAGGAPLSLDPAVEKHIDALLLKMTLDEKVGQLHQLAKPDPLPLDLVRQGRIGSLLNVTDPKEATAVHEAAKASRLGIPVILGYDVIHGYRTAFPIPLAEAASFDPALAERSSEIAAREAAAAGIHWTFAPMVDIARDARWGRVMEGAGEDPFLGAAFAAARVRGFRKGGLAACAKHYVAYGAAEGGRDYNLVDISEATLRDVYLPPFKAALEAGVETFMSSFNTIGGVPATANRHTLLDILKGEWAFKGFVVSDWNSVGELVSHGVAADLSDAAKKALLAGVDMDMEGKAYSAHLAKLVQDKVVPVKELNDAVRRVLRVKMTLGLFEKPAPDPQAAAAAVLTPEHRRAAREVARESIVLLKNDQDLLPVPSTIESIAVIGPLADSGDDQIGFWSAQAKGSEATTVLAALKARAGASVQVTYAKGCDVKGTDKSGFAEAVAAAQGADGTLVVLGESQDMSGEAASRASLDLPGVQLELLDAVVATGKPVGVLVMSGRPLALGSVAAKVPVLLQAFFPGTEGGPAVADILFGDASPSGRLPVGLPRSVGQVPLYYAQRPTGRPAGPEKWTSKYIDERNDALYPFGFGLGYTTFAYSGLEVSAPSMPLTGSLEVRVKVKNTGSREGKEVVQLYVRDLVASRSRPLRELKGFRKVALQAGEEQTVAFTLEAQDLGFHDDAGKYLVEPGAFQVYVGGSSTADLRAGFEVTSR